MALCFEVIINGARAVVAGAERADSLSAHVHTTSEFEGRVELRVQGIAAVEGTEPEEMWSWIEREDFRVGDEITIRIVTSEEPDTPVRRVSKSKLFGESSQAAHILAGNGVT